MEESTTPENRAETTGVITGQPITFGGVAAFARCSWRRLLIVQSIAATVATVAVALFLFYALLPAIDQAVNKLPENAYIFRGELAWPDLESVQLVDHHLLAIVVSPTGTHELGRSADIRVELRATEFRFYSMFGYVARPYPVHVKIPLSRAEAEPWWGARRPFFIGGTLAGTFFGLFPLWLCLGMFYGIWAKFLAFWANRELSWSGAVKLSIASMFCPALIFGLAIAAYGLGLLPLEAFLGAFLLHIVLAIVYVTAAPLRLGRTGEPPGGPKTNPFDHPAQQSEKPKPNPFTGGKE
jgi:hypothetical protein